MVERFMRLSWLGYACYCSKVGIYYILVQVVNMEDGYGILNSKRNS